MINFKPIESSTDLTKWTVGYSDHIYDTIGMINTSFHILQPRLFGLEYADYLRMIRDQYNATLIGRKEKGPYVTVYFEKKADCQKLCKELNDRWEIIING